jgi:hypothetical protein
MLSADCPRCGLTLVYSKEGAAKKARCRRCRIQFTLPVLNASTESSPSRTRERRTAPRPLSKSTWARNLLNLTLALAGVSAVALGFWYCINTLSPPVTTTSAQIKDPAQAAEKLLAAQMDIDRRRQLEACIPDHWPEGKHMLDRVIESEMTDGDPQVRESAEKIVRAIRDSSAGARYIKYLAHKSQVVQERAIRKLAQKGVWESVPELIKMLASPNVTSEISDLIVWALGEIGNPAAKEVLLRHFRFERLLAHDHKTGPKDEEQLERVIVALNKVGYKPTDEMIRLIRRNVSGYYGFAFRMLRMLESPPEHPVLRRAVHDRQLNIIAEFASYYAAVPEAESVLIEALNNTEVKITLFHLQELVNSGNDRVSEAAVIRARRDGYVIHRIQLPGVWPKN